MDATLKAFLEVATAIGVIALFAFLLIYVFVLEQRNRAAAQVRQDALIKQMAGIVEASVKDAERHQEQLELMRQELEAMRQTLAQTSEAKQTIINGNTKALIDLRADYLKSWDDAIKQMNTARGQIVTDVNKHTDEAHRLTGEAITASQRDNTAQHAGQTGDFKAMMEESERKFRADVHEEVLTNGEKTRADLERQLKPIFEKLERIQHDAEMRDTEISQRIHEISTDLSKVVLLVTAPKVEPPTTLVADKPPAPPPVDPLANVPPKAEELK